MRAITIIAILLLYVVAGAGGASAGTASDGDGTMTVSPATAIAGSTGNSFTFTLTATNGKDFNSGSQAEITIPTGWTLPQLTISENPGFITVTNTDCTSAALRSVSGSLILIDMVCNGGKKFTVKYEGGGTKVTASTTTGSNVFITKTKSGSTGTLTTSTNNDLKPAVTVNSNPFPTTSSISPNSKTVGDAEFTMTVTGTNFVSGNSKVRFNGADRSTTYVDSTHLTATIPVGDMATAGTFLITVFNPTPGGGTSTPGLIFT